MNNTNITLLPRFQEIEREAALWAVRLDREDVPADLFLEFEQWRNQSAQHREAAERFKDFWAGTADLDLFNDLAGTNAASHEGSRRWRRFAPAMIAASFAACGAFVYMALFAGAGFEQAYRTAVGEQQTIDLPDGSRIILNTNSALEAEFTAKARIIRLTEGEAYFEVAKNPTKPFSVETEKGTVTAVGTAFSVRVSSAEMNVLVSEGRVALSSEPLYAGASRILSAQNQKQPHSDIVEVDAGQAAVYDRQVREIKDVAEKEIEHQLDWQDGLLAFHGEPLSEVVAAISHYTDATIEIADPSLAEHRVVAYYQVGKIEPMLEALKLSANVKVERIDGRHVRLTQED
ncbi:FecR family protein [Hyphococcus luteus]|uniref:FecR protein domain-containing protein n=1 Tax=Hyphococcus luteus TaxID=2058213 RepID=A0A2S7K1J2_9PROT|nr:FecR domain-containing protein [Marinicaulis flavus]PQA86375.1 hypothetical protein CW354_18770 [Marinicaulis flavus]